MFKGRHGIQRYETAWNAALTSNLCLTASELSGSAFNHGTF